MCPLCGKAAGRRWGAHADFSGSQIHGCDGCEFWFGAPAPSAAALRRYYETTYRERRTWSASREYLALMRRRGAAQCRFIAPVARGIRTAVDIGCGVGGLVAALADAEVDAVGFDSDESVIRIGTEKLRANVRTDYVVTTEEAAAGRCDLLCLSHVVEHFAGPVEELGRLLRRVESGGYVFIEVPSCTSWMFEERVETESHLGFFTPRSLAKLGERLALEVVKMEECGPVTEDYYRAQGVRLDREAARGSQGAPGKLMGLPARLMRRISSPRTEFDGAYETVRTEGSSSRLWLRALFRRAKE